MTRAPISLLLFAALFSGSCTSGSKNATPPPTAAPAGSVEGHWSWVCCDGKFSGTMELRQKDASVEGSVDGFPQDGPGALKGTVEGNVVSLSRALPVGAQEIKLILDSDGKSMQGRFSGPHDPAFDTDLVARRVANLKD